MADPSAPLSVPDADAADLVPPEGAGTAADDPVTPKAEPELADDTSDGQGAGPVTGEAARRGNAVDIALGVARLGVGTALVVAPGWAGRIWVGPGADGPGSLVFARAVGARDVALGLRILDGVRTGEPVRHWVQAGFAADLADAAATAIAGRHLTPARRVAMPIVAGAVGALGLVSTRRS